MSTCRKRSREEFSAPSLGAPGVENIRLGCLQRIADATEAMARPFTDLLRRVQYLEGRERELEARCAFHCRQIATYRGFITRLKRGRKR